MKALLHICCAPCSCYTLGALRSEGIEVEGYWYNPNIHPYREFQKRLATLKEYARLSLLPVAIDDGYELEAFLAGALPCGKDRCLFCYRMRLEKAFQHAAVTGFDAVTTTLLYSRHQRHEEIRALAEELSRIYSMPFLYRDFRKGWNEGIGISKGLNLYRQQYCGCIFSEKERFQGRQ
jgi:epoxyqueuosine reductase